MTDTTLPILYSFRRCPYAMRARMGLAVSGQQIQLREILLRDKPTSMLEASPKGTVPVLILYDGEVLEESLDVMLWALNQADPEEWLRQSDADLALIKQCDGDFKTNLDRYKYATRYEGADPIEHREQARQFLEKLEEILQRNQFLSGSAPGLGDYAIASFIRQFAHTDKSWFDEQDLPALQHWLNWFLQSPLFQKIMEKLAPWEPDNTPLIRY